ARVDDPLPGDREVTLPEVANAVIGQVTARHRELEGQALGGARGREQPQVQRGLQPGDAEGQVVELAALAVDEALRVVEGRIRQVGDRRDHAVADREDLEFIRIEVRLAARRDQEVVIHTLKQHRTGLDLLYRADAGVNLGI